MHRLKADQLSFKQGKSGGGKRGSSGLDLYLPFTAAVALSAAFGGIVVFFITGEAPPLSAPQVFAAPSQSAAIGGPPSAASVAAATGSPAGTFAETPAPASAEVAAQKSASIWEVSATHGAWQVRCQTAAGTKPGLCSAVLQLSDSKNRRPLLLWIVGPNDNGVLQTVIQTPTGMLVSAGVEVKLGQAIRHVDYLGCVQQQCTATTAMDDGFVKDAIAVEKANVVLYTLDGRRLDFGLPVKGFDKALGDIRKSYVVQGG